MSDRARVRAAQASVESARRDLVDARNELRDVVRRGLRLVDAERTAVSARLDTQSASLRPAAGSSRAIATFELDEWAAWWPDGRAVEQLRVGSLVDTMVGEVLPAAVVVPFAPAPGSSLIVMASDPEDDRAARETWGAVVARVVATVPVDVRVVLLAGHDADAGRACADTVLGGEARTRFLEDLLRESGPIGSTVVCASSAGLAERDLATLLAALRRTDLRRCGFVVHIHGELMDRLAPGGHLPTGASLLDVSANEVPGPGDRWAVRWDTPPSHELAALVVERRQRARSGAGSGSAPTFTNS